MNSLLRRLQTLERSQPVVSTRSDQGGVDMARALVGFVAMTFDRGKGSYADQAARLFGLPGASSFKALLQSDRSGEAYEDIARRAYGDDWERISGETAAEAEARCIAVHGPAWCDLLMQRCEAPCRG